MPIEVTSVPDPQRTLHFPRLSGLKRPRTKRLTKAAKLIVKLLAGLCELTLVLTTVAMMRSYNYYSRIVDARLANGYLTSRPGLYAAPRVLQVGQKLSQEKLLNILRRAGYVESSASDVWSGSFESHPGQIEISSSRNANRQSSKVIVSFSSDQIAELKADQITIESFTLEPEILSNDLSSKGGKRELLNYSEIPLPLVHAILSIEDRRFFDHAGIDPGGLTRAVWRNVGDERLEQGGSTITQQLVKNTYLNSEKSLRRKYAEAMLAIALERRLTKEDIFALYCNEVYLGQRGAVAVRGVKEAAQVYFGKELKDLTLNEAATIAGMIQGPARYSPVRHADVAKDRRNTVLSAMQRDGWIDATSASTASAQDITVAPAMNLYNSLAPYFVDYVNRIAEDEFDTSGACQRIYTTIDLELQQFAEQALKHQLDRLDVAYKGDKKPQAALVAIDRRNGNILAMVGGRDYAESQLNRATDALRQPGSTFKPFVYAAALEDGMSPVQPFMDAPREFVYDRNRVYKPANYGGGYSMHEVTMRTGLVKSLNVVTVDIALQTGLARIANLATRFGLPKPERYPALALGTQEVTPLQLASAYAVFANGGRHLEPRAISSISEPPAAHELANESEVVSPTTAYMITNMLSAVIDHGTARKARGAVRSSAVAGKTGTSRDGWFVGYSPNLVCAVWIGFDDNEQLGLTGAEAALPAWVEFMNGALGVRPDVGATNFECPEGIKFVEIDASTGLLSTLSCPVRELIAVTERGAPNMECYFHGNLPAQGSPFADDVEMESEETVAQAKKKRSPTVTSSTDFRHYGSTRV
ncbi:MAG TPA: PBP1A family penicillin-binding protein, partial [Pyrinomonadaceae bacterium]|nr:PBP1A family penicillin-binding protein [Pyrinomonadaceae bacterium]